MTRHEKLTKALEKLCEDFKAAHYPPDQAEDHPLWEEWIEKACASLDDIIIASPTCPPDCGPD